MPAKTLGYAIKPLTQPTGLFRNAMPSLKRWRQEVMTLTAEHLASLQAGKLVAVDVQNEYVLFLRLQAGSAGE